MMTRLICVALMMLPFAADACIHPRSSKAKTQFAARHPCPSTGIAKPSHCTGYVIDHVVPLCLNSRGDRASNMQWQTIADAKAKDIIERRQCRGKK